MQTSVPPFDKLSPQWEHITQLQKIQIKIQQDVLIDTVEKLFQRVNTRIKKRYEEIKSELDQRFVLSKLQTIESLIQLDSNNEVIKDSWDQSNTFMEQLQTFDSELFNVINKSLSNFEKQNFFVCKVQILDQERLQAFQKNNFGFFLKLRKNQNQYDLEYLKDYKSIQYGKIDQDCLDLNLELTKAFIKLKETQQMMLLDRGDIQYKVKNGQLSIKIKPQLSRMISIEKDFLQCLYTLLQIPTKNHLLYEQMKNIVQGQLGFTEILQQLLILKHQMLLESQNRIRPDNQLSQQQQINPLESLNCQVHENRMIKYLINNNYLCFQCVVQMANEQESQTKEWDQTIAQIFQKDDNRLVPQTIENQIRTVIQPQLEVWQNSFKSVPHFIKDALRDMCVLLEQLLGKNTRNN